MREEPQVSDGVVTAYRDGQVCLRSRRRSDGYTMALKEHGYQHVRAGDLVVHSMDAFAGALGVSEDDGKMSPVVHIYESDDVDLNFTAYFLRHLSHTGFIEGMAKGIRERSTSFGAAELGSIMLPVPPLEVQRRVADMLDAETARIDALIQTNQRVLNRLAVRKDSVLETSIYGEDAPTVGLHYLARYLNGYAFKPHDHGVEGLPIVRIQQLVDPEADADRYSGDVPAINQLCSGDLVFSWSGTLTARIWDRGPAFLNQHLFRVDPMPGVDTRWLLHALNATVPHLEAHAHGSTMTHITRPMLTRVGPPKPSLARQREIAASIDRQFEKMDSLASLVKQQIELLETRRRSLITAAVTGQITV